MPESIAAGAAHLLTLRDLLRYAMSRFHEAKLCFGHGSDNAWDEAVYLLLHTLSLPPDTLEPFLDARLLPEERERFLAIVERRCAERVPAAYLTGEAWLQGHRFLVDERVIIPRSPISELLAESLHPWVEDPRHITHALDLCTGSGCLAILTALAFDDARVDALDLSPDALEVARSNIASYGLQNRVHAIQSDLFDALPPDSRYDLIICNPPYVNQASMDALPQEYRHEPHIALAGGTDGMNLVRRILADAPARMAPHGILVLEIGHEIEHFTAAFPHLEPVWLATATSDDQILLLTREQLTS
ncbi:50S ribosomal protein L3 N(5)-glutamine methyltransferase [Yanghanlia caeni]|uniref:Ribosomal protein uL3 glutamine methyltransferase n=1 Tax=Yanghanlia caeni TaxID=3064283 RepID=A0ABU1D770_9BURK|nr:50S ribosomal protein L3 N(5)-glutamine methyltransferase [Alcaligenaceae bacterium LG-2]NGR08821.1 50S ribosomal protein L3 N(5)-glutamine methyltransferase [bacterium SGD-2]HZH57144.1 50S ribosomal protein L3 N(5)-glutamine methyltransferase [Burkholderiaceae bacterium]